MPTLYNTQTRLPEEIPYDKLAQAIASGTHSYKADDRINVYDQNGEIRNVAGSELLEAFTRGYKLESPRQAAVREYIDENKGIGGAAKVALGQFADEALFSIPETIFDATADPLEVAKKEALKKEHALTNALSGIAGFGTSLFVGGPLFKAATTAGKAVERGILGAAEEGLARTAVKGTEEYAVQREAAAAMEAFQTKAVKERLIAAGYPESSAGAAATGLLRKTLASAARMGVEAGVIAAPKSITEDLLGKPEEAAEHMIYAIGAGALLGGAGSLARAFGKYSKDLVEEGVASAKAHLNARQAELNLYQNTIPEIEHNLGRKLTEEELAQYTGGVKKPFTTKDLGEAGEVGGLGLDLLMGGSGFKGYLGGKAVGKLAESYLNEPQKIVDGILFVEKAMKKGSEELAKIPDYLEGIGINKAALSTAHFNAMSRFLGEPPRPKQEEYNDLYSKLFMLENNPEIKTDKLAQLTGPLDKGGAPQVATVMNNKLSSLYSYMKDVLPKPKLINNPYMDKKTTDSRTLLSDKELNDFEKGLNVILDPYVVFKKLGAGTLTENEVKVLKMFYPAIWEAGIKKIKENPMALSYDIRSKLQMVLGEDLQTGVTNVSQFQSNFTRSRTDKGGPVGATIPKFKPIKVDFGKNNPLLTPTQRLWSK